jgi:hypothetical protein
MTRAKSMESRGTWTWNFYFFLNMGGKVRVSFRN